MKFFITLFFSLMALASAAAIAPEIEHAKRQLENITFDNDVEIFSSNENSELTKLVIFVDGSLEGTLEETEEHGLKAFDTEGNEITIDDLLDGDDDENSEEKRWFGIVIRVARMLAPIIRRWGKRAWSFFNCVGMNSTLLNCGDKMLNCAQYGKAPWECASALACLGKSAKRCV